MNMHTQKETCKATHRKTQKRGGFTHIRDLLLGIHKRDVSTHKSDVSIDRRSVRA